MTTLFFIIFEFNGETIIMHTNALYFSYMTPLNFILKCTMANAQVNFSFLENDRGCLYNLLDTSFLSEQDTINGPTAKYFMQLNNYFIVIILNNGVMIWIKNIFLKSFFCQTKGLLHGKKILVQYTYYNEKKINVLYPNPGSN